jgi:protein-S-isoprenylcysteine O-methyltransferase Ste14
MDLGFFLSLAGLILMVRLHFLSVEHIKLKKKHGKERGTRIGDIYGLISGWGLFVFWAGIWVSPQPRFEIQILEDLSISLPGLNLSIPPLHLAICLFFLIPGAWLAINGVKETTLKVAETHRTEKVVTRGVYSIVRHPQYLGGLLSHLGFTFLLSAAYSLLSTPLIVLLVFLISKKEEEELTREFGKEYENYKTKVPMWTPRL